jgi:hypothetical protein
MPGIERSRGLGTKLASLLGAEDPGGGRPKLASLIPQGGPAAGRSGPGPRRDELAFMGLEVLQRAFRLDLAAVAHQSPGEEVQVQLLWAGGAGEAALDTSAAIEAALRSGRDGQHLQVADMGCLTVAVEAEGFRAICVLGRRARPLSVRDRLLAGSVARLVADALPGAPGGG